MSGTAAIAKHEETLTKQQSYSNGLGGVVLSAGNREILLDFR